MIFVCPSFSSLLLSDSVPVADSRFPIMENKGQFSKCTVFTKELVIILVRMRPLFRGRAPVCLPLNLFFYRGCFFFF